MTAAALLLRFVNNNRCLNNSVPSSRHSSGPLIKFAVNNSEVNNASMYLCNRKNRVMDCVTSPSIDQGSNCCDQGLCGVGGHCANSDLECKAEADAALPVKEMDTGTMSHGAVRVTRKRPSPFGSEMSPSPAKWMNLESHKGPNDVIITAYDLKDRRAELGDSSGIPSPVDEDKTNDSLDQDMFLESLETAGHNYFDILCQSDLSFSTPSQNDDTYDVFRSISFVNTSKEMMHNRKRCTAFENEKSRIALSNCLLLQQQQSETKSKTLTISPEKDRILDTFNLYSEPATHVPISRCAMSRNVRDVRTLPMDMNILYKNSKKLLKSVKGFMLVLNLDLVIDFVSENVIDYLGFHHNEMIGQSLSSFIHPSYLPVLDYIRNKMRHRGNCRSLDRCHSIPIQLKHGQDKNSCYRTVHWHIGFMRSDAPITRSLGRVAGDQNVIFSMCIPASTPYTIMPCKMELTTLRWPPHWTFYHAGDEWFLFPFGADFRRMCLEMASITEIIQHLTCDIPNSKSHKPSQFDYVASITCLSNPGEGNLTIKRCSCSRCSHRFKNSKHILDSSTHSRSLRQVLISNARRKKILTHRNKHPPQNQRHEMRRQLRQRSKSSNSTGMLHRFLLCLQRHSILGSAKRRQAEDKRGVNMKQYNIVEKRIKPYTTCSSNFTNKTKLETQEIQNSESSFICAMPNRLVTELDSSRLNISVNKHEVLGEKYEKGYSHQLIPMHFHTSSGQCDIVKGCKEEITEKNNRYISEPCQPSQQIEGQCQYREKYEDNNVSTVGYLSHSNDKRQENQNGVSSSVDEGFEVVGLEDIDLTTEFSFHTGTCDIVMPVENELDCGGDDMVLNNSPSTSSGITSNYSTFNEHNTDLCASQAPNDFSYSFDEEFQGDRFQTFDHILNFPSSDLPPASDDSYTYFRNSTSDVNAELDNDNDCSNKLLMEMNYIVPENKNPFGKDAQPFHHSLSALLKSCDNPQEASLNSTLRKENGKSLLRSLLNKNEEKAAAVVAVRDVRPSPHTKSSRHFSGSELYMQSKHAMQTKELPVPRSHFSNKRRLSMPTPTQELPLPGSALKNAFNSILSPTVSPGSQALCKSSLTNGDATLSNLKQHEGGGFTDLNTYDVVEHSVNPIPDNDDPLPDDLVDLAMEYCNSLDNKQAENLITDLNEQFEWIENMDSTNAICLNHNMSQTSHSLEINSIPHCLNADGQSSQKKTKESINHHGQSSVCLPLSKNITAKESSQSLLASGSLNPSSPSSNFVNKSNHISLLRQAVTSPDVDKLIEKIPLGRNLLSEKHKSSDRNSSSHVYKTRHPESVNELLDSSVQSTLHNQSTARNWQTYMEHKTIKHSIRNRHEKTTAVSHISISAPPNYSKNVSPIKLKIPASSDTTNRRRSNPVKNSSVCSFNTPTKLSTCPNSSSNGVSVMVMRKEPHRSRKSKTVATQTDNHPDEVYPALELSTSDVILTPSVYQETTTRTSILSVKSPPINTSTSHHCNVFSSSLRSLASPRDSREISVISSPSPSQASPSPSVSSTSSVSELELHLRGWSGPNSSSSSPPSSETSEISSEVPFLQRLLTGELSKDKYEKLDKNLLEKQRSSLASKLSSL